MALSTVDCAKPRTRQSGCRVGERGHGGSRHTSVTSLLLLRRGRAVVYYSHRIISVHQQETYTKQENSVVRLRRRNKVRGVHADSTSHTIQAQDGKSIPKPPPCSSRVPALASIHRSPRCKMTHQIFITQNSATTNIHHATQLAHRRRVSANSA